MRKAQFMFLNFFLAFFAVLLSFHATIGHKKSSTQATSPKRKNEEKEEREECA